MQTYVSFTLRSPNKQEKKFKFKISSLENASRVLHHFKRAGHKIYFPAVIYSSPGIPELKLDLSWNFWKLTGCAVPSLKNLLKKSSPVRS